MLKVALSLALAKHGSVDHVHSWGVHTTGDVNTHGVLTPVGMGKYVSILYMRDCHPREDLVAPLG